MRMLRKNKQKLYYSLQTDKIPVYSDYVQSDGTVIKLETGEYKTGYTEPTMFFGNIAMSGGETQTQEYGLNLGDYEAVLVVGKNTLPISETSLIWHLSEPKLNDDGTVDEFSADYTVVKISPSINVDKYVLKKVVK